MLSVCIIKVSDLFMHTELEVPLVQISAKKGIEKYDMRAIQSVLKEFNQFDGKKIVASLDPGTLSLEERMKSLRAINLTVGKKDGRLKARTCVDGRKQRPYTAKEESILLAVSTEALSITLAIDALEKREVINYDEVGACLNTDMDEFTTLKLEGYMVDLMVQVDPKKYSRFVRHEYGKKVL